MLDDYGYEAEAIETEQRDADIEQYEMEQVGNAIYRAEQRGICTHGSAVGYLPDPVYPEQEELKPGELKCTKGCGRVFENDAAWYDAMDAAIDGRDEAALADPELEAG
jgi:hypothetical protein